MSAHVWAVLSHPSEQWTSTLEPHWRDCGERGEAEEGDGCTTCEEKREASRMSWMCLNQPEDSRHDRNPETVC